MIGQIKCLNFAVIELGLYLDTHHDDQKAICLHREYTKQLKELKDQYQRVYGPLSIYYPCKKWRWLEGPWPWEGGNK
ncbi:MAG: spore coat protein CotJB [Clostridia bacterium]|nr:spore coat protein CotJB [Clostridia bacterium]